MSPIEHYRKAESLLDDCEAYEGAGRLELADVQLRKAQVHATLATVEAHTSMSWSAKP